MEIKKAVAEMGNSLQGLEDRIAQISEKVEQKGRHGVGRKKTLALLPLKQLLDFSYCHSALLAKPNTIRYEYAVITCKLFLAVALRQ